MILRLYKCLTLSGKYLLQLARKKAIKQKEKFWITEQKDIHSISIIIEKFVSIRQYGIRNPVVGVIHNLHRLSRKRGILQVP